MSRKRAREDAFKMIFQAQISQNTCDEIFENYHESDGEAFALVSREKKEWAYIEELVRGVDKHRERIDALIEKNLNDWELQRISKVSLAVLRTALYEILYKTDIPVGVAINEAVEIAKKYESAEAGSFVNGVLGAAAKEEGGENAGE